MIDVAQTCELSACPPASCASSQLEVRTLGTSQEYAVKSQSEGTVYLYWSYKEEVNACIALTVCTGTPGRPLCRRKSRPPPSHCRLQRNCLRWTCWTPGSCIDEYPRCCTDTPLNLPPVQSPSSLPAQLFSEQPELLFERIELQICNGL